MALAGARGGAASRLPNSAGTASSVELSSVMLVLASCTEMNMRIQTPPRVCRREHMQNRVKETSICACVTMDF